MITGGACVTPIGRSGFNSTSLMGFIEILKDASHWTIPHQSILKDAHKLGIIVEACEQLASFDLEKLDKLSRKHFKLNKYLAAAEGALFGTGGLALIAADIPLTFLLSFQAIQEIGLCYSFDMEDPEMLPVILSIFSTGSVAQALLRRRSW